MRYLRTEKLRSFHLRPFIVLTITKRTRYKAESEAACRVSVLKQVSPNQPGSQVVRVRVRYKCERSDRLLESGLGWGHGCLNVENNPR